MTTPVVLESSSRCRRCQAPLPVEYLSLGLTCPACEVAYYQSRDRLSTGTWFAAGAVLPWLVFAWIAATVELPRSVGGGRSFSTGIPLLDLALMTAITSVILGKSVLAVRRWVHRREFDRAVVGR